MEEIKLYKYATYVLGFVVILSVVLNITTVMILNDVVELQESHVNMSVDDSMRINNLERAVYHGDYTNYVNVNIGETGVATYKIEKVDEQERMVIENYLINSEPLNDSGIELKIDNR